jgi:polyferredoxin
MALYPNVLNKNMISKKNWHSKNQKEYFAGNCCLFSSYCNAIAILLVTIILWASPALALNVSTGDYRVQLLTDPSPPVVGLETLTTLKVLRVKDGLPAQHGKIHIKFSEAADTDEIDRIGNEDISTFNMFKEGDEHGNYEITSIFVKHKPYYIDIAIPEIEGVRLASPLRAGFTVIPTPAGHAGLKMMFVLATVLLVFASFIFIIHAKLRKQSTDPIGFNYLDIPWIKKILTWNYLQPLFQIPLLIMFVILMFLAFFDIQDGGKNLSTKLIWTVWWAGVIFTFVLVGRVWCFMCPLGAVTEWLSNTVKAARKIPVRMRNVWLANLLFITLTWIDITLGVVSIPFLTGILFVVITVIAVATSLIYERRTFCRYLCPIGGIIGIYSMFSAVELRSKDCSTCKSHNIKECYVGGENGRGCPMFELVPTMDSNNACNFCGECIKSCSKNNISLRFRAFFKDAWTTSRYSLDEATLAIVLVGVSIFVTGDMLEPWEEWMTTAKALVPAELLGIEYDYTIEVVAKSFLYVFFSLILVPGALILASTLSNKLAGQANNKGLVKTFSIFGYMFIPIGLSLHLAHNAGHLLNESGGVVPAVQRFINIYTPFNAGEPDWLLAAEPLIDPSFLYWIQMSLLLIFFVYSLYAGYRLSLKNYKDGSIAFRALLPMVALSLVLVILNVYLLNLPMAPRHLH